MSSSPLSNLSDDSIHDYPSSSTAAASAEASVSSLPLSRSRTTDSVQATSVLSQSAFDLQADNEEEDTVSKTPAENNNANTINNATLITKAPVNYISAALNSHISIWPANVYKTPILQQFLVFSLKLLFVGGALMAGPIYWYKIQSPDYRIDWYDLVDFSVEQSGRGIVWQVEATRWLLLGLCVYLHLLLTKFIGKLVPQMFAALTRWTYHHSIDVFKSPAIQRSAEMMSACSGYFFNFSASCLLFFVTRHLFYHPSDVRSWQYFMERTALVFVVASGVLLLEKMLIHAVRIEFYRSLYQERVYKCMYGVWVVKSVRLYLHHFHQLGVDHFSSAKASQLHSWTLKHFPYTSSDLMTSFLLENVQSSKMQAKRQFCHEMSDFFRCKDAGEDEGQINLKQLECIFTQDHARRAFQVLSQQEFSSNGGGPSSTAAANHLAIDEETLIKSVDAIYQERIDLLQTLSTNASILNKLDRVLLGFLIAVIIYFSPILAYQMEETSFLNFGTSLGPFLFASGKIIGDPIKSICEAIIYIVSCHPYDVGDRVTMDGVDFFVHKIGLISTTFRRFDGFMVWIPNYVMAIRALTNIRRTGPQGQRLEVKVEMSTSMDKISSLSARLRSFIQSETRDFEAVTSCFFELDHLQNCLTVVLLLRHRFNFQDGIQRTERSKKFILFLKDVVRELEIEYQPPVFRSHVVDQGESFKEK